MLVANWHVFLYVFFHLFGSASLLQRLPSWWSKLLLIENAWVLRMSCGSGYSGCTQLNLAKWLTLTIQFVRHIIYMHPFGKFSCLFNGSVGRTLTSRCTDQRTDRTTSVDLRLVTGGSERLTSILITKRGSLYIGCWFHKMYWFSYLLNDEI